ncbi:MAG: hypothetical protein KJ592_04585 [Nanoarchaeota archaeon]|nr:hypothetical protein [Nanoarchaeota archaeon]
MDKDMVSVFCGVVVAASTFIGVGAAIAYYLSELAKRNVFYVVFIEVIYFLAVVTLLVLTQRNIKMD